MDQYAYAMIVYQAFEGHRPFVGLGPVDAARAASTGRRPDSFSHAPSAVRNVVKDCWKEEQGERPRFRDVVATLSTLAESRGLNPETHYTSYTLGVATCTHGMCTVS